MLRVLPILNKVLSAITFSKLHPRLPEFLFLIGTFFFPQVNIELIVRVNKRSVLFTWRDDIFGNRGWHLPGSIILPNESFLTRTHNLINNELPWLQARLVGDPIYLGFAEVIDQSAPSVRSHFISHVFLYDINLDDQHSFQDRGCIFADAIPDRLITNHRVYIPLIQELLLGLDPMSLARLSILRH